MKSVLGVDYEDTVVLLLKEISRNKLIQTFLVKDLIRHMVARYKDLEGKKRIK